MVEIFKDDVFDFAKSNRIYLEAERLKIQGKLNDAVNILSPSIKSDSLNEEKMSNPQILCLLAGILNEQNDIKCVSLYEKVIEHNPSFYLAYRGLGNYYLKNKNYVLSKEYYLKAIGINPKRFGPIYKNLGIVLLELGDKDMAKNYFKKYLEQVPNASDKENVLQFIDS
jgi:tetratricopeptide (TPR) repeat protein